MKRYNLYLWDNPDGTMCADIKEDIDGRYVLASDAERAIAAAVLAERRRVWDVLDVLFNKHKENGEPSLAFAIDEAVCTLFPDGEPQPTNTTRPSPIELLKDLADLQNGPPLEQHRKEWEETMDKVYKCLSEHGL